MQKKIIGTKHFINVPDDCALLDLQVAWQVLCADEYQLDSVVAPPVRIIVDLGCHFGSFSMLVAKKWPKARVVAVDAEPRCIQVAKTNAPMATFIHAIVGNTDAQCFFRYQDGHRYFYAGASFHKKMVTHSPKDWLQDAAGCDPVPPDTPRMNLGQVMETCGIKTIDLLKMDIEGSEYEILREIAEKNLVVRTIVGELHCIEEVPRPLDIIYELLRGRETKIIMGAQSHIGIFTAGPMQ